MDYKVFYNLLDVKPKTRKYLTSISGMSDREVRRLVHECRENGLMVLSSADKAGYCKPKNKEEVQRFMNNQKSYIKNLSQNIRCAEQWIERNDT